MRRVIKVGGSLLLRRSLVSDLEIWIDQQSPAENVVIFGGGRLIDAMRELDAVHPCDQVAVHWRCVALLRATYEFASERFSTWSRINTPHDLTQACDRGFSTTHPTIVCVDTFYHPDSDLELPTDWRTTTDSIAVALANRVSARETVLLKSCDIAPNASIEELASQNVVDAALPAVAHSTPKLRIEMLPTD